MYHEIDLGLWNRIYGLPSKSCKYNIILTLNKSCPKCHSYPYDCGGNNVINQAKVIVNITFHKTSNDNAALTFND